MSPTPSRNTDNIQDEKMRAIGQLAGGIAHDFNNVLTAIIGLSDLLLSSHRPSDPSFSDIMSIKQEADRAATLVGQLLAFSRRQTLHPQVLLISDTLSDFRLLLNRLLGDKVKLELNHAHDLWRVKLDSNEFERVIVNLCVNARDAMSGDGVVTITTYNLSSSSPESDMPQSDYVALEVCDTGSGISQEFLSKIFDPFFTTKAEGEGTGLGLSTAYGIVKQSDGYIYATNSASGGALFKLYFPRHSSEATGSSVGESSGVPMIRHPRKPRII